MANILELTNYKESLGDLDVDDESNLILQLSKIHIHVYIVRDKQGVNIQ